jgi:ribosomal protein S27AE
MESPERAYKLQTNLSRLVNANDGSIFHSIFSRIKEITMSATQFLHSLFNWRGIRMPSPSIFVQYGDLNNDRMADKECPRCGAVMRLDGVTDGNTSWKEFYCKQCGLTEKV